MSKVILFTLILFISLSIVSNSVAQTPEPVTNPGPASTTPTPNTSSNCVPDPPDGLCSDTRPCCGNRVCNAGYCSAPSTPAPIHNPGPTTSVLISPIGNLNVDEKKSVTISGLIPNSKYYWKEARVKSIDPITGGKEYTTFSADCFNSSSGTIERDIYLSGNQVGFYLLSITKASSSNKCEPSGDPLTLQDFSVGGPIGNKACCVGFTPVHNREKDICQQNITFSIGPLTTSKGNTNPTECTKTNPPSFCEADSLQCFTARSARQCTEQDIKEGKCTSAGGIPCDITDPKNPGFQTAIGCIHTSPTGFIKDFLKFILGISGGLAFLMMLLGAFQMLTSAGNPDTLSAGRDRLQSAIIGLLFVIFAVLLLKIIGVDILGIPGF